MFVVLYIRNHNFRSIDIEITKTRDNDTLTIAIAGEIEAVNADELEQSVLGSLDGVSALILDLKDLE